MDSKYSSKNQTIIPEAKHALDSFKQEVASEIGVKIPENGYWGDMTSRECGSVGGNMVKKLVAMGEQQLINKR